MLTVELARRSGIMTLTLPLDSSPEEQADAIRIAAKCVAPGNTIRCYEPYDPELTIFKVSIDRESSVGKALWDSGG